MELIYSVDCRELTINRDYSYGEETATSLSCRNILAFIVSNNVESPNGSQRNCDQFEVCYEVKVLDLDRPWEDYHVLYSTLPIRHLQWDPSGLCLLAIDVLGLFQIWKMEDNLINRWQRVGTAGVKGDEVLAVAWMQESLQTLFSSDKRDGIHYTDKFQRGPLPSAHSLLNSKGKDGWVAITASGMVIVGILTENTLGEERTLVTAQQSLGTTYQQISRADVAFAPDGQVMVVINDGTVMSAIQCYLLSVTLQRNTVKVVVQSSSSFHFKGPKDAEAAKDGQLQRIHQVQFLNPVTSDRVLVVGAGQCYSCLEVWQLVETNIPLHRMYQLPGMPEPANKVRKWVQKTVITHNSQVASIASPRLPMARPLYDSVPGFQSYIALSYRDGSIRIIHRHTFQVLWTSGVDGMLGQRSPTSRSEKRRRITPYLSCLQQTPAGCGLIGQCAGHLYLIRVFNARDSPLQVAPSVIVMLLEYFMFVGQDFWDILLAVRQGVIENIIKMLEDSFNKQAHGMQEMLRMRLMRIKMALYTSLGTSGQSRAADQRALLNLHSIFSLVKSILRPRIISAQDKGPAEKLSSLVLKQADTDLDTTFASLEADEFLFEAIRREKAGASEIALPSLQPILQWVGDFALHLLTSLPQCQGYGSFPGASLLRDPTVLTQLRELLIVTRIWGLVNSSCLPVFNANASYPDCLAHLYKLITKVWVNLKEHTALESDDSLIDECISLSSMVHVPNQKQSFGEESASFSILWLSLPLTFSLGVVPDFLYSLMNSRRIYNAEGRYFPDQHYDVIRHIHLGARQTDDVRECSRCSALSLLRSTARTPLARSWESRYLRNCYCGGLWKLRKTV